MRTAANQARASYTIKVGDTLAGISEMYYGTTEKVQEICALNGISEKIRYFRDRKFFFHNILGHVMMIGNEIW